MSYLKKTDYLIRGQKEKLLVPKALRMWFILHFIVDIVSAIPLFLIPVTILTYFGWNNIDPITTRLFAAALFGIGIESYLGRDSGFETYSNMLNLKIIWSTFAVIGLLISIIQGPANKGILPWVGVLIFLAFNLLWLYWKYHLYQIKRKSSLNL